MNTNEDQSPQNQMMNTMIFYRGSLACRQATPRCSDSLTWRLTHLQDTPRSSTKPCNLAQMTLIELNNKSHEGFVLSRGQENAAIGLNL